MTGKVAGSTSSEDHTSLPAARPSTPTPAQTARPQPPTGRASDPDGSAAGTPNPDASAEEALRGHVLAATLNEDDRDAFGDDVGWRNVTVAEDHASAR